MRNSRQSESRKLGWYGVDLMSIPYHHKEGRALECSGGRWYIFNNLSSWGSIGKEVEDGQEYTDEIRWCSSRIKKSDRLGERLKAGIDRDAEVMCEKPDIELEQFSHWWWRAQWSLCQQWSGPKTQTTNFTSQSANIKAIRSFVGHSPRLDRRNPCYSWAVATRDKEEVLWYLLKNPTQLIVLWSDTWKHMGPVTKSKNIREK